jgi:hypothetical protein
MDGQPLATLVSSTIFIGDGGRAGPLRSRRQCWTGPEPTGNAERDEPHDQLAFALGQTPPPDKTHKVKYGKS